MGNGVRSALVLFAICGLPCTARAYSTSQTRSTTTTGQVFTFDFTSLPAASGTVSVTVDLYGDYDASTEYADVTIDGVPQTRHTGGGRQCNTDVVGVNALNRRTYTVAASVTADGALRVVVDNSSSVDVFCGSSGRVVVTIDYPTGVVPPGDPCAADTECASGFCVRGICCDARCGGPCEACTAALTGGASGTCSALRPDIAVTTTCRTASAPCDVAESCMPTMRECPPDGVQPAGIVCRTTTDVCDAAEVCDGRNSWCPPDGLQPAGIQCRPPAGPCDVPEGCDGFRRNCPADVVASSGTRCRAAAGVCDPAEACDGASVECPADAFAAAGTPCRAAAGVCDAPESCDGASATCPADAALPAGTECRAAADLCDAPEACDGAGVACPSDAVASAGTECRAAAGACDVPESCDGARAACPEDALQTSGTECRAAAHTCDVAESCDGASAECPEDALSADGAVCDDGDACTEGDECAAGTCAGTLATSCADAATNSDAGMETVDAGVGGAPSAGCGCRAAPTRAPVWTIALLAALAVLRRRGSPRLTRNRRMPPEDGSRPRRAE